MKKAELARIVTFIVREELRRQLPAVVERVLTERYLRGLLSERSRDDEVPEPPENDHDGIYHEDNPAVVRGPVNEHVRKLLSPENPFAALYEGVDRVPSEAEAVAASAPQVPMSALAGLDFERMRQAAGIVQARPAPAAPEAPRRHRPEWDRVVDTRPEHERRAAPEQARRDVRVVAAHARVPSNPESAAFPDRPVSFDD